VAPGRLTRRTSSPARRSTSRPNPSRRNLLDPGDLAVGAVAYFLVTGARSSRHPDAGDQSHLVSRPRSPSARTGRPVPAKLERVVLDCLEKRPGPPAQSRRFSPRAPRATTPPTVPRRRADWWKIRLTPRRPGLAGAPALAHKTALMRLRSNSLIGRRIATTEHRQREGIRIAARVASRSARISCAGPRHRCVRVRDPPISRRRIGADRRFLLNPAVNEPPVLERAVGLDRAGADPRRRRQRQRSSASRSRSLRTRPPGPRAKRSSRLRGTRSDGRNAMRPRRQAEGDQPVRAGNPRRTPGRRAVGVRGHERRSRRPMPETDGHQQHPPDPAQKHRDEDGRATYAYHHPESRPPPLDAAEYSSPWTSGRATALHAATEHEDRAPKNSAGGASRRATARTPCSAQARPPPTRPARDSLNVR
jgi:hypothetical protein